MGNRQSRQAQDSPDSGQAKIFSKSENSVEIKIDDLGPEEQEVFRRFADKIKEVSDDQPPEVVLQMLQRELGKYDHEAWMGKAHIRIGIVGTSGAGKSTFINSFRGLEAKDKDEGAADVGTTETTREPTVYQHPKNHHINLVDFPGALFNLKGGYWETTFNAKEYTKRFGDKIEKCNAFLVFTSSRVHSNAVWIAKVAKDKGKKVLFVRSKFDEDVINKKRDDPDYFAGGQKEGEQKLLEEHRYDYVEKLETMGYGRVDPGDVFVISGILDCIQGGRWHADALKEAILKQLDIQQKMLLITTSTDYSPTMVRVKAEVYKSRAWKVALGVAAAGAIPFAGTAINAGTMLSTMLLFKIGFGLDEDSVEKLAALSGKDARTLKSFVDDRLSLVSKITQFLEGEMDLATLKQALAAAQGLHIAMTALTVDAVVDLAVPFVGGLLTAPFSFTLSWYSLCVAIDEYEQCTLALRELAFRKSP